ncbi:hypothetical protein FEK33_19695 [Nocardia asteroides NBRC 15531]|uniref:Uncharacterized protein n=1 Tax=Nocardia asteroides NBRC 15531 TaxID=1110697 RepID=U5ER37_NOCAS|nr:hypothetical protein [Nocardia asteroides]TLF65531.1 hypothetical protein FEK33_19695 [Nocardia asteroides NBRC 15531]UGT47710.1 hypothetical protein LT345_24930 [Nocardia asteroides]GAD87564.1 hypothetical protein NCAST_35_00870 [Nocardia asteroides NBRC 15531]
MQKRLAAFLTVATFAVVGCGGTVSGTPQPGATPIDLDHLRPGPFKNEPTPFEIQWSMEMPRSIRLIESRKMLNHLVHPFDVDPSLASPGETKVFADAFAMSSKNGLGDEYLTPIRNNAKFIGGVSTSQSNSSVRSAKDLAIAVLHFSTEAEATRIADEFHRITLGTTSRQAIEISGLLSARASVESERTLDYFEPYGRYVIWTRVKLPSPDLRGATEMVAKTVGMQKESLDRFKPTPLDDVLDTPLDPENIMRRAAARSDRDGAGISSYEEDFGPFQPSGILHFERHPVEARKKFEETGVDLIGRRASTVYRTRDLASAFQLQTFLATPGRNDFILKSPPGLADSQCIKIDATDASRKYDALCAVVYDRYVAVVTANAISGGEIEGGLIERAAAQYAILKKCDK